MPLRLLLLLDVMTSRRRQEDAIQREFDSKSMLFRLFSAAHGSELNAHWLIDNAY